MKFSLLQLKFKFQYLIKVIRNNKHECTNLTFSNIIKIINFKKNKNINSTLLQ